MYKYYKSQKVRNSSLMSMVDDAYQCKKIKVETFLAITGDFLTPTPLLNTNLFK
jgi:hypothetical protein